MKKLFTMLLVILVCLQVFSAGAVFGAVTDDIIITDYQVYNTSHSLVTSFGEDEEFVVYLNCKNTSALKVSDLTVEIDSESSFYGANSNTIEITGLVINGGDSAQIPINLIYNGTGNKLAVDFKYTLDKGVSETAGDSPQTIYLRQAAPTDDTPSQPAQPTDSTNYQPKLGITSESSTTAVTAGKTTTVNYAVKNSSFYGANNIIMSLELENREKAPYILDQLELKQTIDSLGGNEIKNAAFDMKVLNTAPEGIYAVKVSYQYYSTNGSKYSSSETVYLKVKNNNIMPRLTVDSISMTPAEDAAGGANLKINLKNIGNLPAKDIKITLKGLKSGGFTTYKSTDVKYLTKIDGNTSGSVTYLLSVPGSAAGSSNELTVKMEYRDEMGTGYTDENQIFVPTDGSGDGKPELSFDKILSPQGAVSANQYFKIGFDLNNSGIGTAKNIMVSLVCDKEIVTRSISNVIIDKIDKSNAKHVEFTLFATDDALTKNYPVALNLQYEDVYGAKYNASQYVGVYVENGAGKSVPRIIVSNYGFEPVEVKAGEDFKLKLSFLNTSRTTGISNIKATFTSDDGTFTPSNSSNTFFIEAIATKESVERELMLHVKPDADAKSYNLAVNFDYEDEKGNAITTKETISVPVTQNPRLLTGELSLPPETFAGQPLQVYIDFYNMGKSILYNLMVKAEGDFQGQNLSYYVGNFEPGRSDSFDTSIIPNAPGALKGNIVFSFEDASGKKSEIKKEFSVNVTEMKQEAMMQQGGDKGIMLGPDGKPIKQAQAGFRLLIIGIIVLFVIVSVVVFIILRRKHIKRKEMSLDE